MTSDDATMPCFTRHHEEVRDTTAIPEVLFARLDDPASLAAHMTGASWMMGGGRMEYFLDEQRSRAVGSRIMMTGSAFGVKIRVDVEVIERMPPRRKRWRTVDVPRLLIIGNYEMGFEIKPLLNGSRLRVWIEYVLPGSFSGRLLGVMFAGFYARWCVDRMVEDAARTYSLVPKEEGSA